MNYPKLARLSQKFYFSSQDVADALGIKPESARVFCSRYAAKGIFIRLKNNFYSFDESWSRFSKEEFFRCANVIQVPSYISFLSALSYYEVTTQLQRNFFESASLKRSIHKEIKNTTFTFYKLKKTLYFGFIKKDNFFIATKEKAFLDAAYLCSFGKYKLDFNALDYGKLDNFELKKLAKHFPDKTQALVDKVCKT